MFFKRIAAEKMVFMYVHLNRKRLGKAESTVG